MRHRELHDFRRLHVRDAERNPAARAVHALAEVRNQHDHEQHQRGQEELRRVLVPRRDRNLERDDRADDAPWSPRSGGARGSDSRGIARTSANRASRSTPNTPSRCRARAARSSPTAASDRSRACASGPGARRSRRSKCRRRVPPRARRRGCSMRLMRPPSAALSLATALRCPVSFDPKRSDQLIASLPARRRFLRPRDETRPRDVRSS